MEFANMSLKAALEMSEADIVVLYAPKEGIAWAVKNRIGKSCDGPDPTDNLNMEGAVALLVTLEMGNVRVRPVHGKDG